MAAVKLRRPRRVFRTVVERLDISCRVLGIRQCGDQLGASSRRAFAPPVRRELLGLREGRSWHENPWQAPPQWLLRPRQTGMMIVDVTTLSQSKKRQTVPKS